MRIADCLFFECPSMTYANVLPKYWGSHVVLIRRFLLGLRQEAGRNLTRTVDPKCGMFCNFR
jgi:hypothetical protein